MLSKCYCMVRICVIVSSICLVYGCLPPGQEYQPLNLDYNNMPMRYRGNEQFRTQTSASIAQKIIKGTTTKDEITRMFGTTENIQTAVHAGGSTETWSYDGWTSIRDSKTSALDWTYPYRSIYMKVFFDSRGIVTDYVVNEHSGRSKSYEHP